MNSTYLSIENTVNEKLNEFSHTYGVDVKTITPAYETLRDMMNSGSRDIFFVGDDWSPVAKKHYSVMMLNYFATLKPSKGAMQTLKYKTRKDEKFISVCEKTGLSLIQHIEKLASIVSRFNHTLYGFSNEKDAAVHMDNIRHSISAV